MKTKQEVAELLTSAFNVNKIWDFIESRPFYNKEYMPKFVTAQQIWDGWGSSEKSLYAKFKWKDKYGGKLHPREIANRRQQGIINKLEGVSKTKTELVTVLSSEEQLNAMDLPQYDSKAAAANAARKLLAPNKWSAVYNEKTKKLANVPTDRVKEYAPDWKLYGKYDKDGYIIKELIKITMKTNKEIVALLSEQVSEIKLAALSPEDFKTYIARINKVNGELANLDFEISKDTRKDFTEFESAMKLLQTAISKIRANQNLATGITK
jgi:hypothetical protein